MLGSHQAGRVWCGSILLALGVFLTAPEVSGQSQDDPIVEDSGFVITTESNLVVVPLHVYQRKNAIRGLDASAFEVREDGVLQDIAFVDGPAVDGVSVRKVPTEIIFLIDFSYSVMTRGLLDFTTIRQTMLEGLRDDVHISIYGFAGKLKRFTGPTRDVEKLQRALDLAFASEAGGSRVYEAVMQTARDAYSRGPNVSRKMLIFSDGQNTTSLSPDMAVGAATAFGVSLYPVVLRHDRVANEGQQHAQQRTPGTGAQPEGRFGAVRNPTQSMRGRSANHGRKANERQFAEVGPRTGGRSYDLQIINSRVMGRILSSLAELAETEYVVGYYPRTVDEERSLHSVEVSLAEGTKGRLFGGQRMVAH